MSDANVEIVKRVTDAFNRRDVDAVLDFCASDCVVSSQLLDVSADFQGREGLERFYGMLGESWDEFRSVVVDRHTAARSTLRGPRKPFRGNFLRRGFESLPSVRCDVSGHAGHMSQDIVDTSPSLSGW